MTERLSRLPCFAKRGTPRPIPLGVLPIHQRTLLYVVILSSVEGFLPARQRHYPAQNDDGSKGQAPCSTKKAVSRFAPFARHQALQPYFWSRQLLRHLRIGPGQRIVALAVFSFLNRFLSGAVKTGLGVETI